MKNMLAVMSWDDVVPLVQWAARFARTAGEGLTVVCHSKKKAIDATRLVSSTPETAESATVKKTRAALAEIKGLNVELLEIEHDDPVQAIMRFVEDNAVQNLIVGGNVLASERSERWRVMDRLYRFAPCGAIVIDAGQSDPRECNRILIPVTGRSREPALHFTQKMAEMEDAVLQPFLVGSYIGADSENVAMRELELELSNAGIEAGDPGDSVKDANYKRASQPTSSAAEACEPGARGGKSLSLARSISTLDRAAWGSA